MYENAGSRAVNDYAFSLPGRIINGENCSLPQTGFGETGSQLFFVDMILKNAYYRAQKGVFK